MRVAPAGLFGRTLLTLGLTNILLAALIIGAVVYYALFPVSQRSADDLAAFMVMQAQTWAMLPPNLRAGYVDKLATENDLWLTQEQEEILPDDYFLPYVRRVEQALERRLGNPAPIRTQMVDGRRWFWVDLVVGQNREPLRLGFPRDRIRTRPLEALFAVAAGTLVLVLIASALLARQISRPLIRLGAEVEQIGRGQLPHPLPETGPRELVTFVRQFNRMAAQTQELLANRTTLLAGISHDLRTPISRMRLALEMLAEQPQPQLVERLQQDLEQMNQLISQSLELARNLEAGVRDHIDLADLIDGLVLAQRRTGRQVEWQAETPCPIEINVSAVQRILTNLLENALRYGGDQPPRMELECGYPVAEIRILDRGPGIPDAERDAIFQPFYRVEASRSRDTGGSGLGLAIVRQLADANGFHIELKPRPGGGTLTRVRLPHQNEG